MFRYSLVLFLFSLIMPSALRAQETKATPVQWMTFEEAIAKNASYPKKKIFIDMYTHWCGWCKKMDAETFVDPVVTKFFNENYYCVKMDAERKDTITYNGREYINPDPGKKRSPHQLAAALLQGRMSYPSYVILDENNQKLTSMAGYMKTESLMPVLEYFAGNYHFKMPYDEYKRMQKASGDAKK